MTIAERLKELRNILGWSQEKLASYLKVNRSFLALIETGIRKPSEQTLLVLEKEIGVSKKWLESGEGYIFIDSEKALKYLKGKEKYSIEELYYIFSHIQNLYSLFNDFSVSKDIAVHVIEILSKYSLALESEMAKYIKAIENEGMAWGRRMDEMIAVFTNHIIEKDFDISQELHDELQGLISDWGIYVFVAAAMYEKHKMVPLESIYIDFDSLKKEKAYDEKQIPRVVVENERIKLLNFYGHFVLDFAGKGYIEFEKERLYGFVCAVQNVKNDEKKKVLDYEVFYTEVEKLANIKQKDIALSFSLDEFHSLKECFNKIKENKKMWQWLQGCYVERFGFV